MEEKKKKGKGKILIVLVLTLVFLGGAGTGGYFIWRGTNYLVTENARITTTLFFVTPSVSGTLERLTIREGQYVSENEVLGWVEGSESFRSPFDGLVLRTWAEQNQAVSPLEPVAVIGDINNFHIQANIEETYIARLERGQPVTVTVDALGRQQFAGYVSEIGRVTDSALTGEMMSFTTSGRFTKVTQLLPVRINITDDIDKSNFIGLNARVQIRLGGNERTFNEGHGAIRKNTLSLVSRLHGFVEERGNAQRTEKFLRVVQIILTPVAVPEEINPAEFINAAAEPGILNAGPQTITVRGMVESVDRRNVYTALGNTIRRVYVEAGDMVSEGQILAVLSDTYDSMFTVTHQHAENALRNARIELRARRVNHENSRFLFNLGVLSRDDLRQAEDALAYAQNDYRAAHVMLNAALQALDRQLVRAPINGVVTSVFAREGGVGPGLLFIVEDPDNLRINTRFREYDIDRIKTGMEVAIRSDATGNAVYSGIISRINPAAVRETSGFAMLGETAIAPPSVVEFEAEVAVMSEDTSLRIGTNARLSMVLE